MTLQEIDGYLDQRHWKALRTVSMFLGEEIFFYARELVHKNMNIDARFPPRIRLEVR